MPRDPIQNYTSQSRPAGTIWIPFCSEWTIVLSSKHDFMSRYTLQDREIYTPGTFTRVGGVAIPQRFQNIVLGLDQHAQTRTFVERSPLQLRAHREPPTGAEHRNARSQLTLEFPLRPAMRSMPDSSRESAYQTSASANWRSSSLGF